MEEVKIYHSLWRMMLPILACILFVCGGFFILHMYRNVFELVVGWLWILFFGFCGIVYIYSLLKERLFDKPHLTITDKELIYRRVKTTHVRFADVESFTVRNFKFNGSDTNYVTINYKPDIERQKMENASIIGYLFRSLNKQLINAQDSISVADISLTANELCRLLNERLKQA